jgi:hypothetical protein
LKARRRAIEEAIERLDALAEERQLPESVVRPLRALYRDRLRHVEQPRRRIEHQLDLHDAHLANLRAGE